jgi:hypothetical protein
MKHVTITSGNISRKVTWDQAVDYLCRIKCCDAIATLRKEHRVSVPCGESTIDLSVIPE